MTVLKGIILVTLGLSGGLAVGGALVAFLTVLGIAPRLAQITRTHQYIGWYENSIVAGSVFWTWTGLQDMTFYLPKDATLLIGLFSGMFVGLLAAALTEVLNVLPILAKRIKMVDKMIWLLMAMVFGKVLGSLFHWIIFVRSS
jgi:stage V sporulation protein AB